MSEPTRTEVRTFHALDQYDSAGRGRVWTGPCPFDWTDKPSLDMWAGLWLVDHPDAPPGEQQVVAVESFAVPVIRKGMSVGVLMKGVKP